MGKKSVLLQELIEQAITGTDATPVAEDRDYVKAILAEPEPRTKLTIYAHAVRQIQERVAPLFLSLRAASSIEPQTRDVWDQISERRAANMRSLAEDLRRAGGLRVDLDVDEAADIIWACSASSWSDSVSSSPASPARMSAWLPLISRQRADLVRYAVPAVIAAVAFSITALLAVVCVVVVVATRWRPLTNAIGSPRFLLAGRVTLGGIVLAAAPNAISTPADIAAR